MLSSAFLLGGAGEKGDVTAPPPRAGWSSISKRPTLSCSDVGGYRETQRRTNYWLSVVRIFPFVFGREGKEITMETEMLHPNLKLVP